MAAAPCGDCPHCLSHHHHQERWWWWWWEVGALAAASHAVGAVRGAPTVNARTQEAMEVLAVCLHHKEKLILEPRTLFFAVPCAQSAGPEPEQER